MPLLSLAMGQQVPWQQAPQGYGPGWADYQRRMQAQQQPIQYRAAQPQAPQLPNLTAAPNGQPMGPDPFAPTPPAQRAATPPQQPALNASLNDSIAPQGGGFFNKLNTAFESPLFTLGMSLLGNAQGSRWDQVGADMREGSRQRLLKQRMENEERRLATQDRRDSTVFDRQQTEWGRQDAQRQSLSEWVASLSPEQQAAARANPEAAHAAYMDAQAMANAPITPYQQAQLDLERRGQGMSYAAQMANINRDRPLRGPDASLLTDVRDAAARGQALSMLGDEFLSANASNATGELSPYNPLNFVSPERATMRSASSRMRGYMRPPGSGATSDFEQRLYAMGAPSTTNTGPQNQAIVAGHRAQAALSQARMNFYEQWAYQNGNLYGAEQGFQQSPDFQRITGDFAQRYGDLSQPAPQRETAPGQQPPASSQGFDALPPASQFREGQRITDSQTNRTFVVRNGRWAPDQRRDYARDTLR